MFLDLNCGLPNFPVPLFTEILSLWLFGFFLSRGFWFIFLFLSLAVVGVQDYPKSRPTVSVAVLPTDWGFSSKGKEILGKFCTHPTVATLFFPLDLRHDREVLKTHWTYLWVASEFWERKIWMKVEMSPIPEKPRGFIFYCQWIFDLCRFTTYCS